MKGMSGLRHVLSEQPGPEEVRRQLAIILASSSFRSSKRCHDFLEFIVGRALAGDIENLKERTLAVEVFGRKADAALGEDSIVRVGAREVRKRLNQYYGTEGAGDPVQIGLLAGSYVPVFQWRVEPAAPEPELAPSNEPTPIWPELREEQPGQRRRTWIPIASMAALVLLTLAGWRLLHRGPEAFDAFWEPAFQRPGSVLLAMAHPIVYHPSSRAASLDEVKNGKAATILQRSIHVPAGELTGSDFVPVIDQYVGFGDSLAAARLSILFAQHGRQSRMRMASKLEFSDLRDTSSVLIGGAYTNRWTMELSQKLRYRFAFCGGKPCILDSTAGKEWKLNGQSDDGRTTEDYILACRLLRAETGNFVVIGAGLKQYGTEEAGRILADPEVLVPLLKKLPAGWRTKNVEFILHSEILGDAPTSPELVAYHIW